MIRKYAFSIALFGLAISFFNSTALCCACGHLDFTNLLVNLIGLALTWYALIMHNQKISIIKRIGIGFACVLTALAFLKNIADILWLGHNPLL